jgi:hypothetical protein
MAPVGVCTAAPIVWGWVQLMCFFFVLFFALGDLLFSSTFSIPDKMQPLDD